MQFSSLKNNSQQTDFLLQKLKVLGNENNSLKNEILALHYYMNIKVKELKYLLRDSPDRYLNMDICDTSAALNYLKDDVEYYQQSILELTSELKDYKIKIRTQDERMNEQLNVQQKEFQSNETTLRAYYEGIIKDLDTKISEMEQKAQEQGNIICSQQQELEQMNSHIIQLNSDLQKIHVKSEKEEKELQQQLLKANNQIVQLENQASVKIHLMQSQFFEEYQFKLKQQKNDQIMREEQQQELEQNLNEMTCTYNQLNRQYEILVSQLDTKQIQLNSKNIDLDQLNETITKLRSQINQLQLDNKQQISEKEQDFKQIQQLSQQVELLKSDIENCKLRMSDLYKIVEVTCLEKLNINFSKNVHLKQSSLEAKMNYLIEQIIKKFRILEKEKAKITDQIIKQQDECLLQKEEFQKLEFAHQINIQKIQRLESFNKDMDLISAKYHKIVNYLAEMKQSNPLVFRSHQEQYEIDIDKEYFNLNGLQNIEGEQLNVQQDISGNTELVNNSQFNQSLVSVDNTEFNWKQSIRMTLTPSPYQQKLNKQSIELINQQVQTDYQTTFKSSIVVHQNLEQIFQEIKGGFKICESRDQEVECNITSVGISVWTQTKLNEDDNTLLNQNKSIHKKQQNAQNQNKKQYQLQQQLSLQALLKKELDERQAIIHQQTNKIQQLEDQISLFIDQGNSEKKIVEQALLDKTKYEKYEMQLNDLKNKLIIFEVQRREEKERFTKLEEQMKTCKVEYSNSLKKHESNMNELKSQNEQLQLKKQILIDNLIAELLIFKEKVKNLEEDQVIMQNIHQKDSQDLTMQLMEIQRQFENRPPREVDTERIYELEGRCQKLELQLKKDFCKVEKANTVVKYLQIELENYKNQYNLFSNSKVKQLPQKRIIYESKVSEDDDDRSLIFDKSELPYLKDEISRKKTQSKVSKQHGLSDFEIKQHKVEHVSSSRNKKLNISRQESPMKLSRTQRYPSRRFHNPLESDNFIQNAVTMVEGLKNSSAERMQLKGSLRLNHESMGATKLRFYE